MLDLTGCTCGRRHLPRHVHGIGCPARMCRLGIVPDAAAEAEREARLTEAERLGDWATDAEREARSAA